MSQHPAIEERNAVEPGMEVAGAGDLRIANRVITKIAAAVTREEQGLHLTPPGSHLLNVLTQLFRKNATDEAGVRASLRQGREVTLDLWVSADFGVDIPAAVGDLQRRIEERIRSMTGFRTKKIRVNVVDVILPAGLDR